MSDKNNLKKDHKETSEGMFNRGKENRKEGESRSDTELYEDSKCKENDTGIKIPTEEAVEEAREFSEDKQV